MKPLATARGAGEPRRILKDLKPHPSPDTPDASSPKFRSDDAHVAAVRLLGGFPALWLPPRRSRLRPAFS